MGACAPLPGMRDELRGCGLRGRSASALRHGRARAVHAEEAVGDDEAPAAGRAGHEQALQVREVVVAVHAHGRARARRQPRAVDDGRVVQLVREHHGARICGRDG